MGEAPTIRHSAKGPNSATCTACSSSAHAVGDAFKVIARCDADSIPPSSWLMGHPSAHITARRESTWGDGWVRVRGTSSSTLVRSMAYIPGWRATAFNLRTSEQVSLPVHAHGLVQQVSVPAGEWEIHFHYHAPSIEAGVVLSTLATSALLMLWLYDYAKFDQLIWEFGGKWVHVSYDRFKADQRKNVLVASRGLGGTAYAPITHEQLLALRGV